jgi:hypothetical protein
VLSVAGRPESGQGAGLFVGAFERQPVAAGSADEQPPVSPHPAAGLLRSRAKLMPAERHRSMAVSTSVTPICQVSTLGGSLAASAFWMPKCTVPVPKPMNSGYSGPW